MISYGVSNFYYVCDVVPEPGLVFLFDHSVLHDGELVQAGRKYAIRTEVMYRGTATEGGELPFNR